MLERWLWYFIKNYESNEEVDCCKHLMEIYLNDEMQSSHIGQIDEDDRKIICEFVTKSFNSNQRKLFGAEFVDSMNIGNATTGASEGYHSGIKKSHLGSNANDPMHVTAEKLVKLSGSKEVEKSQRAAYDSNATYGKAKDRKGTVQQFSTFCNNKISSESESSADFFQFRADENTFFIKQNYDKVDMDAAEELGISVEEYNAILCKDESAAAVTKEVELSEEDTMKIETLREKVLGKGNGTTPDYAQILLESMKYIIPRFERTRVVKLIQLPDGTWILVCSCGLFKQMGYACRHKYKLLRRDPKSSDAKVRWNNGYCEDYGSNDELTSAYMALRSANLPGIPVTDEEAASIKASMQVGSGDKHEDFFRRSLNKLCLRGEKTFWHENADRFQDALQNVAFCVPIQNSVAHGNTASPFPTRGDTNVPTFAGLPSTSFGPTKMIHSTGTRMVPSQREELANEDNVNAEIDICWDSNAKDLSERFLPCYETICKYAEACGDDGIQVMAKHFDHCQRRFLHFIHNSNVSDNDVAVHTSPKSSNPYHNFKLPYERICSMAQRGGDLGIDAASEEFAACLEELVAFAGERNLCTQKVNARRKKVTSPRRSAKKQPRR